MTYHNIHVIDPKFLDRQVWPNSVDPNHSRSNLIRVYTVCHSICIFWTHKSMVKPHWQKKDNYNNKKIIINRGSQTVQFLRYTQKFCGSQSSSKHENQYSFSIKTDSGARTIMLKIKKLTYPIFQCDCC